jgi:pimeloyl-ACP methyl ester carboxylesterase
MTVVYLHGAGRSGRAAWPVQDAAARPQWTFLERVGSGDDPHRDAKRLLDTIDGGGHIVAQSYGGLAAMLAASQAPQAVRSLILCEPLCISVAQGRPRVREHVAALLPVYAVAEDPTVPDEDFARRFAASFSEPVGAPRSDVPLAALRAQGQQLRTTIPPWEITVPVTTASLVPTLVVTGGRDSMYDEIAAALTQAGADHLVVPGFGHRPQDDPRAIEWMTDFWIAHNQS